MLDSSCQCHPELLPVGVMVPTEDVTDPAPLTVVEHPPPPTTQLSANAGPEVPSASSSIKMLLMASPIIGVFNLFLNMCCYLLFLFCLCGRVSGNDQAGEKQILPFSYPVFLMAVLLVVALDISVFVPAGSFKLMQDNVA